MTPTEFDAWLADRDRRSLLMGVLNVTPDSFSDGGNLHDLAEVVRCAREMIEQGAAVLDVGGESTRPGAGPVTAAEQISRVVPAIAALRTMGVILSVDTADADVAAAALDAGATMLNDISAGRHDSRMFALAAERQLPIAIMHMQGEPRTMQQDPRYDDVVMEVRHFLVDRAAMAVAAGVAPHRLLVDVGIGFGKTIEHNLLLLKHHARIAELGYATLLGTSRKGFVGKLTGVDRPADRVMGTAATVAWGAANGANLLRVHDVEAMRQTLAVIEAIRRAGI
jgi:dihydropteroate synthase